MSTSVGLNFRLTAAVDKFEASMRDVETRLGGIEKASRQTASGMKLLAAIEVGKLLVSGLSTVFGIMKSGVSTVTQFASQAAAAADAIGKLSSSTGMAHEPLQVFTQMASYGGVSSTQFGDALQKMSRGLGEAASGTGTAGRALQKLGLSVDDLLAMSPSQQFLAIGSAIGKIADPAQRSAIAADIFGRSGTKLIPMFEGIEDNVKATANEMLQLGQVLSGTQVKNIEAMNDSFEKVRQTAIKIGTQVLANFAPMITKANEQLLEFIKNFEYNGLTGGQGIVQFASDQLEIVVKALAGAFDKFLNIFIGTVHSLLEALDSFLAGLSVALAPMVSAETSAGILNAAMQVDHFAASLEGFSSNVSGFVDGALRSLHDAGGEAARQLEMLGIGTELSAEQIKELVTGGMDATSAMSSLTAGIIESANVVPISLKNLGSATQRAVASLDISGPASLVKDALSALIAAPTVAASGLSGLAQGFLDVLAPLGYTKDRILELGKAASIAKDFRSDLFDKHMAAWDQQAMMVRDRLISNGMNAFDANYLMMQERSKQTALVNQQLDQLMNDHLKKIGGLNENTDQVGQAALVLGEKLTGAAKTASTWLEDLTSGASNWWDGLWGGEEGSEGPQMPEAEETLPELQRQTGTLDGILQAAKDFGLNFVLASF